ncbi:2OG-Fe(II) oxygenase [Alloalcanivorax gelatiniphagus]|uniref:2OG-Fe(II) oxygenase n=1 Tax=Alloalcanivorax gelatiniphagus TaxID=1194167 RepID=A0ABY2XMR4_9GAMM|nr:2OG-Fe(II) oxygenase [Alloalcanivorax gelatiniphagus]TMW13667.1 2OG-Fe(II) oxygenase [Alloalcanivorax gelatiniphagus]|tara:strand:- start:291 stop:1007 length:717 start_codon:yes stop_codon:yes gene_type:complete
MVSGTTIQAGPGPEETTLNNPVDVIDGPGGDRCQRLIDDLVTHHYAVAPDYFPAHLIRALRQEALLRDRRGEFQAAGIGRGRDQHRNERVRRDRTLWLDGSTLAQCTLLEEMEQLRLAVNRALFLGLFDLEAHFALYDPGAFYRRHLDAFNGNNGRVLSAVLYLNRDWRDDEGGRLRIWSDPDASEPALDVAPRAGTLVCFLSDRIPHEVLEAQRQRLSIAGWFRCNNSTAIAPDPAR